MFARRGCLRWRRRSTKIEFIWLQWILRILYFELIIRRGWRLHITAADLGILVTKCLDGAIHLTPPGTPSTVNSDNWVSTGPRACSEVFRTAFGYGFALKIVRVGSRCK